MGRSKRPRPKNLGRKLRAIRNHFGLTQAAMCKRLNFKSVYPWHISGYEHNKREPPYPVVLKYARIAGCSTDLLLDDKLDIRPRRF